jgi:hypothetical protein
MHQHPFFTCFQVRLVLPTLLNERAGTPPYKPDPKVDKD